MNVKLACPDHQAYGTDPDPMTLPGHVQWSGDPCPLTSRQEKAQFKEAVALWCVLNFI